MNLSEPAYTPQSPRDAELGKIIELKPGTYTFPISECRGYERGQVVLVYHDQPNNTFNKILVKPTNVPQQAIEHPAGYHAEITYYSRFGRTAYDPDKVRVIKESD